MSEFTGWKAASGAGGKFTWWVCNHETHASLDTPKGRLRRFATREAAQKVADQMNARPKSYCVRILTSRVVDVSKNDIETAALESFKELIEWVQAGKVGFEIEFEIKEV